MQTRTTRALALLSCLAPVTAALDSSASALSAALNTVSIGSAPSFWGFPVTWTYPYTVNVGDKLQFSYSADHNVYLMASESAYDTCDFAGATELAGASHGGGSGSTPNVYEAVATAAGTLYIACRIGSHCSYGQKVEIVVVEPPAPISPPPASPPPSPPVSHSATGCAGVLGKARSVVAVEGVSLAEPSAMAWHPTHPEQLWVADAASDALSVVNTTSMAVRQLADRAPFHYMDKVSAIAFDPLGQFATCQESINTYEGQMLPNYFMGPTLYDSRIYLVDSRQQPCAAAHADSRLTNASYDLGTSEDSCFLIHTDMLHEAPLCMGIAHDAGSATVMDGTEYRNVYWAYDGGHRQLVRFDFESDHGPGSMDHAKAAVRRYAGLELGYVEGIPAHMHLDDATRELFVADPGHDRVLRVLVDTGHFLKSAKPLFPIYSSPEDSFNYTIWEGLQWSVLGVVPRPSGLAITAGVVYVGSHALGQVFALDRATGAVLQAVPVAAPHALRALALAPADGALWFLHGAHIGRLHVSEPCAGVGFAAAHACADGAQGAGETDVDCGGALCRRCALGAGCAVDNDCASGRCAGGTCRESVSTHGTTADFLYAYFDSDWHRNSFAHHMLNGEMGGASYLNPYPIMEADFCATVGINATTGELDCSAIDYDSLLLGGCWCHTCLPINPCRNGGTCVNYQLQGYTCNCTGTGFRGDHCHLPPLPPSPPPPPPSTPPPPPSPLPSRSPPPQPTAPGTATVAEASDSVDVAVIIGPVLGVVALIALVLVCVLMRRRAKPPSRFATAPAAAEFATEMQSSK